MTVPTHTLPSGDELPAVGAGTWDLHGETLIESVRTAIDAGYTHIDTAEGYRNEADVGAAIEPYERENLFLTSKVLPKNLGYESVVGSCRESLERLDTDYLDLYLIHWPNPAVSLRETLSAMSHLKEQGMVRNVGVSNFTPYQLDTAQHVSDAPIAVNQIEFHPWFQRPDFIEHYEECGVAVEAAAPLGRTEVFGDEVIAELAEEKGVHPAQIILRWALEHDVTVIPKSSSPENVRSNIDLFGFELSEAEIERIDGQDRDEPVYDTIGRDWGGPSNDYGISQ
jgi:diketogulonate reductase-like aldo/keto reductase